jgi:hypothetical protein
MTGFPAISALCDVMWKAGRDDAVDAWAYHRNPANPPNPSAIFYF